MMFYANSPPFSDIHQFLPSMCKTLNHLKTCWHAFVDSCPSVNLSSSISNVIGIHQVVCDISNDEGAATATALWAHAFRARKSCQVDIQAFSIGGIHVEREILPLDSIVGMLVCLIGSLHDMIDHDRGNSSPIITQFKQLLSQLEELHHVIAGKIHIGVSVHLLDVTFASPINGLLTWMERLIAFFLVQCQFVDYDPQHVPGF